MLLELELVCNCHFSDVIYIGSVHTMHFPLCKLFLGAGYNVLCEKPLVINSAQCQEVVALARAKNVFFMEVNAHTDWDV